MNVWKTLDWRTQAHRSVACTIISRTIRNVIKCSDGLCICHVTRQIALVIITLTHLDSLMSWYRYKPLSRLWKENFWWESWMKTGWQRRLMGTNVRHWSWTAEWRAVCVWNLYEGDALSSYRATTPFVFPVSRLWHGRHNRYVYYTVNRFRHIWTTEAKEVCYGEDVRMGLTYVFGLLYIINRNFLNK